MITLTVARRVDSQKDFNGSSGRDSVNSVATNSSGTETLGGFKSLSSPATPTPDHSGISEHSDGTVYLGGTGRHHVSKIIFVSE